MNSKLILADFDRRYKTKIILTTGWAGGQDLFTQPM